MARVIWKFPISTTDIQSVDMPKGAEILTVQNQNDTPCIWALVDSENETVKRTFEIHGTGNPIDHDYNLKYIGTYQQLDGRLVWHLFEL